MDAVAEGLGEAEALVDTVAVISLVKVLVKVRGQTVVDTATVEVTTVTDSDLRGQFVTVAGHCKTVTSEVA